MTKQQEANIKAANELESYCEADRRLLLNLCGKIPLQDWVDLANPILVRNKTVGELIDQLRLGEANILI